MNGAELCVAVWTIFAGFYIAFYLLDVLNCVTRSHRIRKSLKMEQETTIPSSAQNETEPKVFNKFCELHEDLMMNILSYVADAPLEISPHSMPRSMITGVLPLVCRQFNEFCRSQYFWSIALERLRVKDSYLWEEGIMRMLPPDTSRENPLSDVQDFKGLFRRVFDEYIRFRGPVFYMTGRVRIGHAFGLHFFEPRYRLLIQEIMQDWPQDARQGANIIARNGRFPTFIYAHMAPLAPTTPACLVQVRQCVIHDDGSSDVMLLPVAYVWLESVRERPNSWHLFEATVIRMGLEQAHQMEGIHGHDVLMQSQLVRFLIENRDEIHNPASRGAIQQILSYLMGGLPVELRDDDDDAENDEDEDDNEVVDMRGLLPWDEDE